MSENKKEVTDLSQAIGVLMQGVQKGQAAGIYSFADSTAIGKALEFLNSLAEQPADKESDKKEVSQDKQEE